jgi:hypothetical protein
LPAWHPADTLLPTSWLFPQPGTKDPYAEIRYLPVRAGDRTVWRFRAVNVTTEPRALVGAGYFDTLEDAAAACHRDALHALVKPQLSVTPAGAWG